MNQSKQNETLSFWGKLVLLMSANLALIPRTGLSAAMPEMLATFADVPGAEFLVSMIITLPALFIVFGGPVTGLIVDRVGRKPVLVGSILVSGLAGAGAFFLKNIFAILVTRALLGVSIAGAMTATTSLIADYYSGQQRAKFMGYHSAFLGLGVILFFPLGGLLADISWEYAFLNYLFVLLFLVPAMVAVREPVISTSQDNQVVGIKFSISRTQRLIYVAVFILQFTFITMPVFLAFFMREILNVGGLEVGLVGGFSGLMTFLGGISYERVGRRQTFQKMMVYGFFLLGVGFAFLALAGGWFLIILGTSVLGFSLGINIANLTTWLAHEVSPAARGRANGLFMTMRFLAEFLGSLVFTAIVSATSFHFGYLLSAIVVVTMAVFSSLIKRPFTQVSSS